MNTRLSDRCPMAVWYGRAMPHGMLNALGIALVLSILSACSAALNFNALSSQARDAGLQNDGDAARSAPKAGSGAAGKTGSRTSGVSADDSAATSFSCAAQNPDATLCDDFEGPPLAEIWSYLIERPGGAGSVQSDRGDARSPEHSLLAVVNEGLDPAGDVALGVGKDLSSVIVKPTHVVLDFDMKLELYDERVDRSLIAMQVTFGMFSEGWYGQLSLSVQNTETGLMLAFAESDVPIVDGAEMRTDTGHPPVPFAAGAWVHVHFEFDCSDRAADSRSALLLIGDTMVFDGNLAFAPRKLTPHLELGAPWVDHTGGSKPWRLRYDNVLLRVNDR